MAWGLLVVAGLFEVIWAVALKMSDGFTRMGPAVVAVVGMAASIAGLTVALKSLPVGTGYAVWTGIGAAGTAILGMIMLGEPVTALRIGSIGVIVLGIIGLRLA